MVTTGARVKPRSLLIPTQTQAFYIDQDCNIEELVKIPLPTSTTIMAGGGIRTPGHITPPQSGAQPTAAAAIPFATPTAMLATGALMGVLQITWAQLTKIWVSNGQVCIEDGAEAAALRKKELSLSAEQIGELAVGRSEGCYEEWETAERICRQLLSGGDYQRVTGEKKTLEQCTRGLVSEDCKGNKVDWGNKGAPPSWRP